jgi:hypothetical protein
MACRCTVTYRFGWVDEDENTQYSGWTTQNVPAASTVFTVVQVVLISAGGVTSTKTTPGDAETLVVGMGAAGETITISAAANLDVWPAGYPLWGGDKIPDGSNGSASINWPIDVDGIYTVSAACGAAYSVALKIYVVKIVEIMVRPANQPSATYTGSTTIAAGAKADAVHQADVRLKIAPVPPPTVSFSVGQPVKLVNYSGFNGANNASLDVLTPNPEGSVSFASQYRYGKLTSSNVMHGAAGGLAPCQVESVRSSASAAVTFAPSDYEADDKWVSSVEYILPGGTSDETVTMKLDGAPLVGHDMHFFVEKVELWDCLADPPEPVTIENTAVAPDPFIATFADFTTSQTPTGSDGRATGVLWTEDVSIYGYEWVSVTLCAYDYDALSSEGTGASSSSSMSAMASASSVGDAMRAIAHWLTSSSSEPEPDLVFDGLAETKEETPGGFLVLGGDAKNLVVKLNRIPAAGSSNLTLTWTHPEKVEVKQGGSVKSSPQIWTWPTGSSSDPSPTTLTVKGIAGSGTQGDVEFTLRYNNNPKIQDTVKVTNLKVEIEKCASAFLPKGGEGSEDNTTTIRAFVTPNTVKGRFKLTLYDVSDEAGYCVNAPATVPGSGEDSDSWKDLQFPTQTNFTISGSDNNVAETTTTDVNEATVTVKSFDCGAYGKIKVEFTPQGSGIVCVGKEQGGTDEFTRIPRDADANNIADCWSHNAGGNTDDTDTSLNNTMNGDGLTRYQEYRGIDINADGVIAADERLDPAKKDLFVRGSGYSSGDSFSYGGAFSEAQIMIHEVPSSFCDRETDVMVVTHDPGAYPGTDGHMNKTGVRTWTWDTKGSSTVGTGTSYGDPKTYKLCLDYYFSDSPYDDNSANSELDYISVAGVEDVNDNGVLDANENDGPGGGPPADDGDGVLDGDHVVISGASFDWAQELADDDIDDDGLVELPRYDSTPVNSADEYSKAQVLQHTITHEMGHAGGISGHCSEPTCLMYSSSNNWKREGHFCDACRAALKIHNN